MFQSKIDITISMPSFCINRLTSVQANMYNIWFRSDAADMGNEPNYVVQKWPNNWGLKSMCDSREAGWGWGVGGWGGRACKALETGHRAAGRVAPDWLTTRFHFSALLVDGQKQSECSDLQSSNISSLIHSSCRKIKAGAVALQPAQVDLAIRLTPVEGTCVWLQPCTTVLPLSCLWNDCAFLPPISCIE